MWRTTRERRSHAACRGDRCLHSAPRLRFGSGTQASPRLLHPGAAGLALIRRATCPIGSKSVRLPGAISDGVQDREMWTSVESCMQGLISAEVYVLRVKRGVQGRSCHMNKERLPCCAQDVGESCVRPSIVLSTLWLGGNIDARQACELRSFRLGIGPCILPIRRA